MQTNYKKLLIGLAVFFAALVALTCAQGCATVAPAYQVADRATYNAIAPEYLEYVANDPTLEDWQKDNRRRTIETWNARIQAIEVQ